MESNEQVIRAFLAAWSRLDAHELAGYFTEDAVYHNMPTSAAVGRAEVEARIARFIGGWTATQWEGGNLASNGDVVIVERVDRTTAGARQVDLPCTGVFVMRDGKIAVWRDYFDLATYQRAMS